MQQITYFLLIFGLAPLQIVTGLAMSPELGAHFPKASRILGGRQAARSIHFLGLVAFVVFFVVHVFLVIVHGFAQGMALIVLGGEGRSRSVALLLVLSGIVLVVLVNIIATRSSLRRPATVKRLLESGIDPLKWLMFHHWTSKQNHGLISPFARVNGRPPRNDAYTRSVATGFEHWRLRVDGMVEVPLCVSLAELRAMTRRVAG